MAVEIITRQDKEALLTHYYQNIQDFAQDMLPHWLSFKTPAFHKDIYELIRTEQLLAISAPRGFAKSTVCSKIYPIWAALFKQYGDISIVSASEDFVVREIMTPIRQEFETNKRLIKLFGEQKTDQWAASYFKLKNGIAFEGLGVNGQLRGGRRGVVILDDVESNESVLSEEQRSKLRDKVNKEIIPKLLPDSICVIIGTIIHPLCYLREVLNNPDNGWTKREYRAYHDAKHGDTRKMRQGNELWAEMWSHDKLQKRKAAIGSTAFASEYLNDPVSDNANPIKPEYIKYWDTLPDQLSIYLVQDPAYTENEKSDFKVTAVIGVDSKGNRYLIEYLRTHLPLGEYIDGSLNLYVRHKTRCVKFGCPGGREVDFYRQLENRARDRGIFPPLCEIKYTIRDAQSGSSIRNKHERIVRTLQPHFENGTYFIHRSHKEAHDELLSFASGSMHDDLVDAMSGAEQLIEPHWSFQEVEKQAQTLGEWDYEEVDDSGTTGYGDNY